jgi:hypothetical protein
MATGRPCAGQRRDDDQIHRYGAMGPPTEQTRRWDMRSARWLPPEPEREAPQRPWLEAPSPYDYGPAVEPRSETKHQEDEEESVRVIIIDM